MDPDVHAGGDGLAVLRKLSGALVSHVQRDSWLRQVRSRRTARSELSRVRCIVELLVRDESLWQLLDHERKLDLEVGL